MKYRQETLSGGWIWIFLAPKPKILLTEHSCKPRDQKKLCTELSLYATITNFVMGCDFWVATSVLTQSFYLPLGRLLFML